MSDEKQIHEYIGQMKNIEEIILEFLDKETDDESYFIKLNQTIDDLKIKKDKYILKELLLLIAQISRNYHHFNDFFNKIERILNIFKENIKTFYTKSEIFSIFSKCKRILLYLFEEKLLIPEEKILNIFIYNEYYKKASYAQYFSKEFKDLIKKIDNKPIDFTNYILDGRPKPIFYSEADKDPELFEKKRKIGENDNYICELIRNDSVKDFIIHVNRMNIPLSSRIQNSIYETNNFLIKHKNQTLIEYAAFFGSIQIFQYLRMNNVDIKPSLFMHAIHGKNPELIHLLEESVEQISDEIHEKSLIESIKCHHFELTNYIYDKEQINTSFTNKYLKYYNFIYLNDKIDDLLANLENFLFDLCTHGNIQLAKYLFKSKKIDINMKKMYKSTKKIIEDENNGGGLFDDFFDMISTNNNDFNENEKTITINEEKTPLIIAIEKGNNDIVELLLQQPEIDVNLVCDGFEQESTYDGIFESKTKKTALFASIENDNFDIVEFLLKHPNIDVQLKCTYDNSFNDTSTDESGRYKIEETPLFIAVCHKKYQIVKLLLSRDDVDVNSKFRRIEYKLDDNIKYTIEDYIADEKTALHEAAYQRDIEMMKILLSCKKIDLNSNFIYHYVNTFDTFEDDDGTSYDEIVKQGNALFIAIDKEFNEIADLLLSKSDFDVNAIYKIIKYVTKSANNNVMKCEVKKEEFTALHFATEKQNIGVIKKLLEFKNIDVNAKDEKGRRPIDLTNNEEIKALLKK